MLAIVIGPSADKMADVKYRDLLKQLRGDGWEIVVIRGSPNDDVHPRTLKSIRRQAGWER